MGECAYEYYTYVCRCHTNILSQTSRIQVEQHSQQAEHGEMYGFRWMRVCGHPILRLSGRNIIFWKAFLYGDRCFLFLGSLFTYIQFYGIISAFSSVSLSLCLSSELLVTRFPSHKHTTTTKMCKKLCAFFFVHLVCLAISSDFIDIEVWGGPHIPAAVYQFAILRAIIKHKQTNKRKNTAQKNSDNSDTPKRFCVCVVHSHTMSGKHSWPLNKYIYTVASSVFNLVVIFYLLRVNSLNANVIYYVTNFFKDKTRPKKKSYKKDAKSRRKSHLFF